uniref:Venom metalloproteinase BumaMPs1 n=1 Tax=Olivierus martensii TaxID=34649 RepID=VMP_OLIMR|nr:RecName: Full=Venom metalloproteinase BumaMPs1; Short=MPs1; AltName: Full=Acid trehalase; Flags: Precursor [Mesobuthus martensii]AHA36326.1 acid trehalase [Mesobuthus martensii]
MFVHLLVLLFAAVEAIPTGRFEVVYPSMVTFRSGIKRIRFRALDEDIELRLEPAGDVIADDFTVINGENGEVDHSVNIQSLKRKLYKDAKVGAALHIDEDGSLIINGIVNSKLRIEPDTSKKASRNGIIAHRVIEVIEDEQLFHDVIILPPGLTRTFNYSEPLPDDKCVKIEYVFVTESSFTKSFQISSMETYLANMMNMVKIMFDSLDLGIEVAIIGIIKLTKENEAKLAPYIPLCSREMDSRETLDDMAEFYCNSADKLIQNADIVTLITTRPLGTFDENGYFFNIHLGIAFLDNICVYCYKYAIVKEDTGIYQLANTVAHESAHLLGCDHDGEKGSLDCSARDGYIMSWNNEKIGKKFSPCCKKRVEELITRRKINHCIVETCDGKRKRN